MEEKTLLRYDGIGYEAQEALPKRMKSVQGVLKLTTQAVVFSPKKVLFRSSDDALVIPLSSILVNNGLAQVNVSRQNGIIGDYVINIVQEDANDTFVFSGKAKKDVQNFIESINELLVGERKGFDLTGFDPSQVKDGIKKTIAAAKPITADLAEAAQPLAEAAKPIASVATTVAAAKHPIASVVAETVISTIGNNSGRNEAELSYVDAVQEATGSQIHNASGDLDNQIEQLKTLKSLLDEGILTQEEFDQKKKQIMGL